MSRNNKKTTEISKTKSSGPLDVASDVPEPSEADIDRAMQEAGLVPSPSANIDPTTAPSPEDLNPQPAAKTPLTVGDPAEVAVADYLATRQWQDRYDEVYQKLEAQGGAAVVTRRFRPPQVDAQSLRTTNRKLYEKAGLLHLLESVTGGDQHS